MSNKLPENYKQGVTRVSTIVSHFFPFEGTDDEKRYFKWLEGHKITPENYLTTAQDMGTLVHNSLEDYINGCYKHDGSDEMKEVEYEIEQGQIWLTELGYKKIETEKYVLDKDDRFQGAVDLLYTDKDGKIVLADWKTFGIAKKRFGLNNNRTLATKKKKKVEMQMSLYAYALRQQGIIIDRLELLFLHEQGMKIVTFKPFDNETVEELLNQFINYNKEQVMKTLDLPIEVIIQLPSEDYGNVKIKLDLASVDNGKTDKENIDALINKAHYIRTKTQNNGSKN